MAIKSNESTENERNEKRILKASAPPFEGENAQTPTPANCVDFCVCNEDGFARCDISAISSNSPILAKLIDKNQTGVHYPIQGISLDNLKLLFNFFENKNIQFYDDYHVIIMLESALRFKCFSMIRQCAIELDLLLNVTNVIRIYQCLRLNCTPLPTTDIDKAWKSKKKEFKPDANDYLDALFFNVLQFINMNADSVFTHLDMLNLRFEELSLIVLAEDLVLSSEMILYNLLAKWSIEECKRRNYDITTENRRTVLGRLSFSPRYLTMAKPELNDAFARVELLDPQEKSLVLDAYNNSVNMQQLTDAQKAELKNFRMARPIFAKMPIFLSARSDPKKYPKKMRRQDENQNPWWIKCILAFACIFD